MVLGAAWCGRHPVTVFNQEGSNPFRTAFILSGVIELESNGVMTHGLLYEEYSKPQSRPRLLGEKKPSENISGMRPEAEG